MSTTTLHENAPSVDEHRRDTIDGRAESLFYDRYRSAACSADSVLVRLLLVQWLFGILLTFWVSPLVWAGMDGRIHIHVLTAVVLGGLLSVVPFTLASHFPGQMITRHAIALAQIAYAALLIHFCGGRIESHFYIFASLAILALYRDWRVVTTGAIAAAVNHIARGIIWPESVYGLAAPLFSLRPRLRPRPLPRVPAVAAENGEGKNNARRKTSQERASREMPGPETVSANLGRPAGRQCNHRVLHRA